MIMLSVQNLIEKQVTVDLQGPVLPKIIFYTINYKNAIPEKRRIAKL